MIAENYGKQVMIGTVNLTLHLTAGNKNKYLADCCQSKVNNTELADEERRWTHVSESKGNTFIELACLSYFVLCHLHLPRQRT